MLAVGDGALGLWAALREVFPETHHQRCWNHKAMNLTDNKRCGNVLDKWRQSKRQR